MRKFLTFSGSRFTRFLLGFVGLFGLLGLLGLMLIGGAVNAADDSAVPAIKAQIKAQEVDGKVNVTLDGKPFTTYDFSTFKKPILFPVIGPGGVPMTRSWPVVDGVEGEAKDHPHHKGIWFSFDDLNGRHFWHEIGRASCRERV